ncbi:MAG: hypothetical protein WA252_10025 [Candidatus Sulfotelmatobacter sp.]
MSAHLDSVSGDSLRASIRDCIETHKIDVSASEHRFLLFRLDGPGVLFEDNAPAAHEIAGKVIDRAPRTSGPPIYANRPPFDRGAILDSAQDEILAYELKPF